MKRPIAIGVENYKTIIKEINDASNNRKIPHALGLEELILLKWLHYLEKYTDLM